MKPKTTDDLMKIILDFLPHAHFWEDIEGEMQISTGMKVVVIQGERHLEPVDYLTPDQLP